MSEASSRALVKSVAVRAPARAVRFASSAVVDKF